VGLFVSGWKLSFRSYVKTTITELSPAGTAELSPGRSPGLACAWKSPVGTIEKVIGSGILNRGRFSREVLWRSPRGNCQSSLRDFSSFDFYPGLRPGLSSAVPAGLILLSVLADILKQDIC
jgi:hypothetical protein